MSSALLLSEWLHWLAGLGLLLLLGCTALLTGLFPRRRGETPYCRKCRYNLTGLALADEATARCPECGVQLLTNKIVRGERVARKWRVAAGALCLLIGLGGIGKIAWGEARNVDWYRHKPVSWVLGDLENGGIALAQRAMQEIERRERAAPLSERYDRRLIELCLAEQVRAGKRTMVSQNLMNRLGLSYNKGDLTEEQARRFFENGIRVTDVRLRPIVILGNKCPLKWELENRLPNQAVESLHGWASVGQVRVDGEVVHDFGHARSAGAGWRWSGTSTDVRLRTVGMHQVSVDVGMRLYAGGTNAWGSEPPVYQRTETLTTTVEVLATEPADYIATVSSLEFDQALATAVELSMCRYQPGQGPSRDENILTGLISVDGHLPIGLACDVEFEFDGRSWPAGKVVSSKGKSMGTGHTVSLEIRLPDEVPDTVNIVLRASKAQAAGTVDLFEIWAGEIRFDNVRVQRVDPATITVASAAMPMPPTYVGRRTDRALASAPVGRETEEAP